MGIGAFPTRKFLESASPTNRENFTLLNAESEDPLHCASKAIKVFPEVRCTSFIAPWRCEFELFQGTRIN
ncbi:hypothetical protein GCM10027027_20310 [Neomicrococcus lactis]